MNRRMLLQRAVGALAIGAGGWLHAPLSFANVALKDPREYGAHFSRDFLRASVNARQAGDNVVISPVSLTSALLFAAQAAMGRTETAFARTLRVDHAMLDRYTRELREAVLNSRASAADSGISFESVQGMWVANALVVNPLFEEQQRNLFDVKLERADFAQQDTVASINAWFRERTHEKIPQLLDRLDPGTQFVIGDATYFKGAWRDRFQINRTESRTFTRANGERVKVPMMEHASIETPYFQTPDLQAIQLPFQGGLFSLVILLPRAGLAVTELLEAMPRPQWQEILSGRAFGAGKGRLRLPRFDLSGGGSLTELVQELGLKQAFEPCADFSWFSEEPLRLSDVIQKASFSVNEEGAEASAATAIAAVRSARPVQPVSFDMSVERPFIAAIQHRQLPAPIILARVGAP